MTACRFNLTNNSSADTIELTVSAASNLTPAFQEIGESFEEETGIKVIFNFGSSGQLAEQIRQGAPVDVFASADVVFLDNLEKEDLIFPETKIIYAEGCITLWIQQDSSLKIETLEDLKNPDIERIAIANPELAPYGKAAQEALISAGVWDDVVDKIVLGENIARTLSYGQTGEVDVAIIALSLSLASDGEWVLIPHNLYNPIAQSIAITKFTSHKKEAEYFVDFVNSNKGHEILVNYGFSVPAMSLD